MKKIILILLVLIIGLGGLWLLFRKGTSGPEESVIIPPDGYELDKDRDGIADAEETALGLSTETSDTDNDGISDRVEIEEWKTDPTKADTDGDGFPDGFEILSGFNPLGDGPLQ
jgi:hypothetical protein